MKDKRSLLSLALAAEQASLKPTPISVFELAHQKWVEGKTINLSEIAVELGIGRATVFRWVGSRDALLEEILWARYLYVFKDARKNAPGQGIEYVAEVFRRIMQAILDSEALQRFIKEDPHYALRLLAASRELQARRHKVCQRMLEEQTARGYLKPRLDIDSLANIINRITESFTYSHPLVGRKPAVDQAVTAIRMLLEPEPPSESTDS